MQPFATDVKPEDAPGLDPGFQRACAEAVDNLGVLDLESDIRAALARHDYQAGAELVLAHPRSVALSRLSVAFLEAIAAGRADNAMAAALAVHGAANALIGPGRSRP